MKSIIFFMLLSLAMPSLSICQGINNNWCFSSHAWLNFSGCEAMFIKKSGINTSEGSATISSAKGELLFYTDGNRVWNRRHRIMPNGTNICSVDLHSSTQAAVIVPLPGSNSRYYVFFADEINNKYNAGIRCAMVDMGLDNGYGDVVFKDSLLSPLRVVEKVGVVRHANGRDYWVIYRGHKSDKVYSILVTEKGIIMPVLESYAGRVLQSVDNAEHDDEGVGQLRISPEGNLLACCLYKPLGGIELHRFDNASGQVTGSIYLSSVDIAHSTICSNGIEMYCAELSSKNKLFVLSPCGNELLRFDCSQWDKQAILASVERKATPILGRSDIIGMRLAPNNKIYTFVQGVPFIHTIENPDAPRGLWNFQEKVLTSNNDSYDISFTFPTPEPITFDCVPHSFIQVEAGCLGALTQCTMFSYKNGVKDIVWDFGDPASGSNNKGSGIRVSHAYTQIGDYIIRATINYNDGSKEEVQADTRMYAMPPMAAIEPEYYFCYDYKGDFRVQLSAPQDFHRLHTVFRKVSGSSLEVRVEESGNAILPYEGEYDVEVQDEDGCYSNTVHTRIVRLFVPPKPIVKIIPSCGKAILKIEADSTLQVDEWLGVENGTKERLIEVMQNGSYAVRMRDSNGCTIESEYVVTTIRDTVESIVIDGGVSKKICRGDSVEIKLKGDWALVQWNTGDTTVNIGWRKGGQYSVRVRDSIGCEGRAEVAVEEIDIPQIRVADVGGCKGMTLTVEVLPELSDVSYQWRDTQGSILGTASRLQITAESSTWYIVRATNGAGCTAEDTAFVTVNNAIVIDAGTDQTVCAGEAAELSIMNYQVSTRYEWREEKGTVVGSGEKIQVSPQQSTRYVVHGIANGCEGWDTVAVTVNALPQVQGEDQSICEGQNAELSIMNYEVSLQYEWKEEGGKVIGSGQRVSVSPTATTRYIVEANNTNSCIARDTVTVSVEPKTRIVLSVSDSVGAETKGDMEIIIYAQANRDVEVQNLRYSLHATGEVFGVEGAKYINGEVVIAQQQKVKLSTSKAEIARIKGVALVSQRRDGMIRITDMSTELDTSCTELSSTVGKLHTEPVCANNLRGVVVGKEVLLLSPNPSTGKVDLQSEYAMEELRVYNSLGEEVQVTAEGTESHRRSIDLSASGIYFVRVKMFGSWLTRSVVVQH